MRAERIVSRGFRNFADLDLPLPSGGAVFLGPNGHGITTPREDELPVAFHLEILAVVDGRVGSGAATGRVIA